MARVIIYNADGTVASVSDSSANQGAAGPIAATTLGNSGDSNLSGNLSVAGSTMLKGSTSTANLNVGGSLGVVGPLTAVAITLQTGGKITFADGTVQSTAGGSGGGSNSNGATGAINASSIANSGDTTLSGKLSVAGQTALNGNVSVARLLLQQSGGITFSDGSIQTTATLKGDKGDQGAQGPAASGDITATSITDSGNLTVQGTTTTKAISATTLTTSAGVSVGTTLAVTGNTTLATVTSGLITASSLTLSASGKITFADGTTQSTAAVSSNPGSAAQFTATAQGTANAPAFTASGTANTGAYFTGTGTTSAVAFAANGSPAGSFASTGLVLPTGTKITFPDGTTQTTASAGGSSTASPGFRYTSGGAPTASNPATQYDGDTAFDPQNLAIYGPRANGAFPTQPFNLLGPTGPQGPKGDPGAIQARNHVYAGSIWNTAATANTVMGLSEVVQSGSTNGQTPLVLPMIRSGSVTGFSFNQVGPVSGTFSVYLQKNGSTVATLSPTGSGVKSFGGTFAAGTYTFNAGDTLNLAISTSGSGNIQGVGFLEIQTA